MCIFDWLHNWSHECHLMRIIPFSISSTWAPVCCKPPRPCTIPQPCVQWAYFIWDWLTWSPFYGYQVCLSCLRTGDSRLVHQAFQPPGRGWITVFAHHRYEIGLPVVFYVEPDLADSPDHLAAYFLSDYSAAWCFDTNLVLYIYIT